MKRLLLLFCIVMLMIPLGMAQPKFQESPYFKVTLLSQSPDPVEPGGIVEVRFKVENFGKETKDQVVLEVLPRAPLTLFNTPASMNLGTMRGRQVGANAAIASYKFQVAPGASEVETELEAQIKVGDLVYQTFTLDQFFIDVNTRDAVLSIASVRLGESGSLTPGEKGTLHLMIDNQADSLLKNIRLNLNLTDGALVPFQQSSEKRLAQLQGGFQAPLIYEVLAKPDAKTGVYTIPFELNYEDARGKNYTKNDVIAVTIGGIPELQAYIRTSTITGSGQRGIVTIELANSGSTDIKFLQATILNSEDYEVLSTTNTRYIGDVDSDDIETEDFELYMKESGTVHIPLKVTYKDSSNAPYEQIIQLPLRVFTKWELSRYGIQESSSISFFIILLVIGGGVYYWYYYRRKKKA